MSENGERRWPDDDVILIERVEPERSWYWFWIHGAAAWFSALALASPHTLVRAAAAASLLINVCAFMRET